MIRLIKEYVDVKYGSSGNTVYYGIATAAWRNASNGVSLRDQIYQATNVPIKIITQDEEAELRYEGVVDKVHQKGIIVWGIGGGSMQLVTKNEPKGLHYSQRTPCGTNVY